MTAKFEDSFYLQAYRDKGFPLTYETFKEQPTFQCEEPTISDYKKKYNDSGWLGRKVIAIPAAAFSATVKVIYHLARAIIFSLCLARIDKAEIFSIVRDLQEAAGHLVAFIPFCDCYGLYHVEQASFYKTKYQYIYFEEEDQPPSGETLRRQQEASSSANHPLTSSGSVENLFRQQDVETINFIKHEIKTLIKGKGVDAEKIHIDYTTRAAIEDTIEKLNKSIAAGSTPPQIKSNYQSQLSNMKLLLDAMDQREKFIKRRQSQIEEHETQLQTLPQSQRDLFRKDDDLEKEIYEKYLQNWKQETDMVKKQIDLTEKTLPKGLKDMEDRFEYLENRFASLNTLSVEKKVAILTPYLEELPELRSIIDKIR